MRLNLCIFASAIHMSFHKIILHFRSMDSRSLICSNKKCLEVEATIDLLYQGGHV
jgi:hypothetical protein